MRPHPILFRLGRRPASLRATAASSGDAPARPTRWKANNPRTVLRWYHFHAPEVLVYTESAPLCAYLESRGYNPVAQHDGGRQYKIPRDAFALFVSLGGSVHA